MTESATTALQDANARGEGEADTISFTALLAVLARLKSKNRNPDRDWYLGWNSALDCLINDISARTRTPTADAKIAELENRLNKDSQYFEILCLRETEKVLREALRWLASRPPLSVETVRSIADRIMEGVNLHPSSEVTYDQLKLRIRRELHGIGVAGSRVFENGPCWCDIPNPESGAHMPECATARAALAQAAKVRGDG